MHAHDAFSDFHFSRSFLKHFGMAPSGHLSQCRRNGMPPESIGTTPITTPHFGFDGHAASRRQPVTPQCIAAGVAYDAHAVYGISKMMFITKKTKATHDALNLMPYRALMIIANFLKRRSLLVSSSLTLLSLHTFLAAGLCLPILISADTTPIGK